MNSRRLMPNMRFPPTAAVADHTSKRMATAAFFCRVISLPTNVSRILGADLNRSRPSPALARIISIAVRRQSSAVGGGLRLLSLSRVVFFVDVGQTPGAVAVELQHRLLIRIDVMLHAGRHHEETARRQWIGLALVRTGAFS